MLLQQLVRQQLMNTISQRKNRMVAKGIGPQGLGAKGHKGLWIGDASPSTKLIKDTPVKVKTKKK